MKKTILVIAILLTAGMSVAFAKTPVKVSAKILGSFKAEFGDIPVSRWKVQGDITLANFLLNNSRVEAYFSADGELLGTARSILYHELPLPVTKQLNKSYESAAVYEITEIVVKDEVSYRMIVETKSKKFSLLATPAGYVSVVKRLRK
jgi:hypothetical protein